MKRPEVAAAAITAFLATGCASYQPTPTSDLFMKKRISQVEKMAPFDLDCDPQELTYREQRNTSLGVEGCGRRVRYKLVGGVGWVADAGGASE